MSEIAIPPAKDATRGVRNMTPADVPAVSQAMARAFFDDPVVGRWCLADESHRLRRMERVFELFLRREYLAHDECYTTEDLAGGAFWLPPGAWKLGPLAQLSLVARTGAIAGRATPRIARAIATLEASHPHDPHYYLPFVGVEPDHQGRGIGSALLSPVLERCDREGLPAYLEATCERSVPLYERLGFAVVADISLPAGGPSLWRMWREPRR